MGICFANFDYIWPLNEQIILNTIEINNVEISHLPTNSFNTDSTEYENKRLLAESVLETQKLVTEQKERNLKSLIETFFPTTK